MEHLWAFISRHDVIFTLVAYILFSNAVSAIPTPGPNDSKAYRFWFSFLHGIAANLLRIPAVRSFFNGANGSGSSGGG